MYDQSENDLLRMLADRTGIAADYYDIAGTHHVTTDETRRAILAAMNLRVATREELIAELEAWDNRWWLRGCEPVHVLRLGRDAGTWSLYVPCEISDDSALQIQWSLLVENGATQCERTEGPGLKSKRPGRFRGAGLFESRWRFHRTCRLAISQAQPTPREAARIRKPHSASSSRRSAVTFLMNFSKVFDGGALPCSSIRCGVITIGGSGIFEIWVPSSNGRESAWAQLWSG